MDRETACLGLQCLSQVTQRSFIINGAVVEQCPCVVRCVCKYLWCVLGGADSSDELSLSATWPWNTLQRNIHLKEKSFHLKINLVCILLNTVKCSDGPNPFQ